MLDSIASVLHQVPELALFLALALGYAVGQIRFGPVSYTHLTLPTNREV